ncbi:tetratricopeptide repeat protein [Pseudocolwellia sp. HL-MZ19]|uniref:tetratricopeptide repeat protein n=1 Tax=unclassified Pseudocolwellia TaxID=2848178 RepID=UPI003CF87B62
MSVINQMLKELEERNDPQGNNSNVSVSQGQPAALSKVKIMLIILLIILINIGGIYGWSLYSENQTLKQSVYDNSQSVVEDTQRNSVENIQAKTLPSEQQNIKPELAFNVQKSLKDTIEVTSIETAKKVTEQKTVSTTELTAKPEIKQAADIAYQAPVAKTQTESLKSFQLVSEKENMVITPLNDNMNYQRKIEPATETPAPQQKQASLSISRSHLSAERVVQNKLQKAERAITDNEVTKAEKLFEEVLLIQPDHNDARKQLSALWFGRKLYRPALNLLSQGMDIYPDDIDFRLMKARILLNQNNNKEALYVLNGFATAQHVEYQVLLANTAQMVGNSDSAILAYRQLVNLEPHQGKWWMGLGVELDRDSQFEKAKLAYKTALSTQSLSNNSAQFIRQRMSELGE